VRAKDEKKEALARINADGDAVGVSPTQALFRENGAPPPPDPTQAPTPPPPSAESDLEPTVQAAMATESDDPELAAARVQVLEALTNQPDSAGPLAPRFIPASDLSVLLDGIQMPAGLTPITSVSEGGATSSMAMFVTSMSESAHLGADLEAELSRLGCLTMWIDSTTAVTRKGNLGAVISVYNRPRMTRDADGKAAFPDLPLDAVVVRLTAV